MNIGRRRATMQRTMSQRQAKKVNLPEIPPSSPQNQSDAPDGGGLTPVLNHNGFFAPPNGSIASTSNSRHVSMSTTSNSSSSSGRSTPSAYSVVNPFLPPDTVPVMRDRAGTSISMIDNNNPQKGNNYDGRGGTLTRNGLNGYSALTHTAPKHMSMPAPAPSMPNSEPFNTKTPTLNRRNTHTNGSRPLFTTSTNLPDSSEHVSAGHSNMLKAVSSPTTRHDRRSIAGSNVSGGSQASSFGFESMKSNGSHQSSSGIRHQMSSPNYVPPSPKQQPPAAGVAFRHCQIPPPYQQPMMTLTLNSPQQFIHHRSSLQQPIDQSATIGNPSSSMTGRQTTVHSASASSSSTTNSNNSSSNSSSGGGDDRGSFGFVGGGEGSSSLEQLNETGYASQVNICEMIHYGLPDPEVIAVWLSELRFEEYISLFTVAGYDLVTVARMTPEDLTAIGITKPGHRKRLTSEIHKLKLVDNWPIGQTAGGLAEWLTALRLPEYIKLFQDEGFHSVGQVLQLTWEDFEDCGISKLGHLKKLELAIKKIKDFETGRLQGCNGSRPQSRQDHLIQHSVETGTRLNRLTVQPASRTMSTFENQSSTSSRTTSPVIQQSSSVHHHAPLSQSSLFSATSYIPGISSRAAGTISRTNGTLSIRDPYHNYYYGNNRGTVIQTEAVVHHHLQHQQRSNHSLYQEQNSAYYTASPQSSTYHATSPGKSGTLLGNRNDIDDNSGRHSTQQPFSPRKSSHSLPHHPRRNSSDSHQIVNGVVVANGAVGRGDEMMKPILPPTMEKKISVPPPPNGVGNATHHQYHSNAQPSHHHFQSPTARSFKHGFDTLPCRINSSKTHYYQSINRNDGKVALEEEDSRLPFANVNCGTIRSTTTSMPRKNTSIHPGSIRNNRQPSTKQLSTNRKRGSIQQLFPFETGQQLSNHQRQQTNHSTPKNDHKFQTISAGLSPFHYSNTPSSAAVADAASATRQSTLHPISSSPLLSSKALSDPLTAEFESPHPNSSNQSPPIDPHLFDPPGMNPANSLDDIGSMLANLSEELDAMLSVEGGHQHQQPMNFPFPTE